jgi:hypothetical protein
MHLCARQSENVPLALNYSNRAELIPYLIRALNHPEMRSVMTGNTPDSVNSFLVEMGILESITEKWR